MDALQKLEAYFRDSPPMAIAVSGGVDSMTLAVVANRVNPATHMFHAVSPAVPLQATARVRDYAERENWQLTIIDAGEMLDENYLANPANRCYFCKTNLYDTVVTNTDLLVASGTNLDDLGDYRPGLIAAEEHQVRHPYVETRIDKATLREIAGTLNLDDLKDLPAAPCLSSRVTTGIAIDANLLPLIDRVEREVWSLLQGKMDLQGVRCRIRENEVALQIESADEFDPASTLFTESTLAARAIFTDAGFADRAREVLVEPYVRGSAFLVETVEVS
jgi:uncharacterized protein